MVIQILLGLDANINTLVDVIDTRRLSTDNKVDPSIVIAFASAYGLSHVPVEYHEALMGRYYDYLVKLFQISQVERKLISRFQAADTDRERQDVAYEFYQYRSNISLMSNVI